MDSRLRGNDNFSIDSSTALGMTDLLVVDIPSGEGNIFGESPPAVCLCKQAAGTQHDNKIGQFEFYRWKEFL